MDDERSRHADDLGDKGKVFRHVVGQRLADARHDRETRIDHGERVAIRRGFDDDAVADDAGGAGAIVDDKGLPELLGELLRDDAAGQVERAAGGERHDYAHRPVRISVGAVRRGGVQQCQYPQSACDVHTGAFG